MHGITILKAVKYCVSVDLYLNRKNNFLKNLTNATFVRREAETEFPNRYPIGIICNFYERYIYEVLNHNMTTGVKMTKEDFILPTKDQIFEITIGISTLKIKYIIGKIQHGLTN